MNNELVLAKAENGIFEIQLNRPDKLNALTDVMYGELIEKLNQAESDPEIKVILLRSSSQHFCAGNDLADFLETEFNFNSNVVQFLVTMACLTKPIVAAVSGAAVGIGTTMLLHCDLVYCAENTKFSLPFIKLGLTPEGGSSQLLAQRCGTAKANDWLFTGRNILSDEALASGLVNQVFVDVDTTWSEALSCAVKLAKSSSEVLIASKKLIKAAHIPATIDLIRKEAVIFAQRLASDEAQSAFSAFLNR